MTKKRYNFVEPIFTKCSFIISELSVTKKNIACDSNRIFPEPSRLIYSQSGVITNLTTHVMKIVGKILKETDNPS